MPRQLSTCRGQHSSRMCPGKKFLATAETQVTTLCAVQTWRDHGAVFAAVWSMPLLAGGVGPTASRSEMESIQIG
jgi:hypothetical protein